MDFVSKGAFFIMYGISILIMLFFFGSAFFANKNTSTPISEPIILSVGGILTGIGLYLGYQAIQNSDKYFYGCGILGLTWLTVLFFVIVCYWIFVPIHWQ